MTLRLSLFVISLLLPKLFFGQQREIFCNEEKDIYSNVVYKKFKRKVAFSAQINYVVLFGDTIRTDVSISEAIRNESHLINLNDTLAFRFFVARIQSELGKEYLFRIQLYEFANCWSPINVKGLCNPNQWYFPFDKIVLGVALNSFWVPNPTSPVFYLNGSMKIR